MPAVSSGEAADRSKGQKVEPSHVRLCRMGSLGDVSHNLLAGESSMWMDNTDRFSPGLQLLNFRLTFRFFFCGR